MHKLWFAAAALPLVGAAPASLNNLSTPKPTAEQAKVQNCPKPESRMVNGREDKRQFRKLNEMPPGRLILAVDQRVDGCAVLVLPAADEKGRVWLPAGEATVTQVEPARIEPASDDGSPPG